MTHPNPNPNPAHAGSRSASIRWRVLSLVLMAALVPAILVGVISFLTARGILLDKVEAGLTAQAGAASDRVEAWFEGRREDTEVFASSFLVAKEMARWATEDDRGAGSVAPNLESYLTEVSERYPLYRSLSVLDRDGVVIASSGNFPLPVSFDGMSPLPVIVLLDQRRYAISSEPIVGPNDEPLGSLVTLARLAELWGELGGQLKAGVGDLRLFSPSGELFYPADAVGWEPDNPAVAFALEGRDGTAEYRSGFGDTVVGAFRSLDKPGLGLLVELPASEAFAASNQLRTTVLLIALLSAALGVGLSYVFASKLTRPIRALLQGAEAVSGGDLAYQVPHRSGDQLSELVDVFNRMTHRIGETHEALREISITDELTGLNNRRHLTTAFEVELNRARRSERPLSVLLIDLDRFKVFNDQHGHLEGDAFLRFVGGTIREQLRSTDLAARFGGEEFAILLPDTNKEDACRKAETLCQAFRVGRRADSAAPTTTVSIGVATWREDGQTEEELLKAADEALYAAKREGRDRVVVAGRGREAARSNGKVVAIR